MRYKITRNDENYASAINYNGTNYYNTPMTIKIGKKLYILEAGTSDDITVRIRKNLVYIVSENNGLNYIGMQVIDTKSTSNCSVFLNDNDLSCEENLSYNLLDKTTFQQIKIMSEYLT